MKKITIFNISLLIILVSILAYYKFFSVQEDILYEINTWEDLIKLSKSTDTAEKLQNNTQTTNYKDKWYALEFLNFCYELADIKKIQSKEFVTLANIQQIQEYMKNNNITEPKECLNWVNLKLDSVRKECIFNNDDGIHIPYIASYINWDITSERFNKSMLVLSEFYLGFYPSNSISLLAVHDKNTWKFTDKSYCDQIIIDQYDVLIRWEDSIHRNDKWKLYNTWSLDNVSPNETYINTSSIITTDTPSSTWSTK